MKLLGESLECTTFYLSWWSFMLVPHKKWNEKMIGKEGQRGTKRKKNVVGGVQEKGKKGSSSISLKGGLVGNSFLIPLGALIINLLSRFWGHNEAYDSNHFLEQRMRIVTTVASTSIDNKTMKVKRLKDGGFCVFVFLFFLGFVLWWVFLKKKFFQAQISFYHQEVSYYLQIKHNKRFLSQKEKLCHNLGFCHSLGEIAKQEKKIEL